MLTVLLLALKQKIPYNVIEVLVVLMELLLKLKLVQSSVHHTCSSSLHSVHSLLLLSAWGLNLLPNFLKGEGLTGSQFIEGVCWKSEGNLFEEGLQFLGKK